ncbi:MAG TPA: TIGR03621 family F420-dependent LLM class oxidoreductase [Chloroflexota bacterium]|nr:TIGR03621 family F420-dependent LLM class oxidoreductase [Chloroflexota bacterium]
MAEQRAFRFGVAAARPRSRQEWAEQARKAEALGYAVLLLPDHFGDLLAPIPTLVAAADATTTLRLGTFVLCNDFRHPAVLAQEAATIDLLSDGRLELGLGAGWLRAEYEQAGIAYEPGPVRVARLEESVRIVKGLLAGETVTFAGAHYTVTGLAGLPRPVQQPHPPLLVGGGGRRILTLAAREADIVSLAPRVRADGTRLDALDATPEALARKIAWVRQAAGERFAALELNLLALATAVTPDRRAAAAQVASRFGAPVDLVLATPHLLLGTIDEIAAQLQSTRARYGISYVVVFEDVMDAFAPVVARLAGT